MNRSYEKLVNFYAYVLKVSLMEKNSDDFKKYATDAPFKELIGDYLFKDTKLNKIQLIYSEHKDEISVPDRPSKLFENVAEKKIADLFKPEDPSAVGNAIMQVN